MKKANMEKVRSFFECMELFYGVSEDEIAEALQNSWVQGKVKDTCDAYREEQEEAK